MAKSEGSRGHARSPLACGCSGDSGSGYSLRCPDGEALWNAMQVASRAANQRRRGQTPDSSGYTRAREAYLAHVAAHKATDAPDPRGRHPQWEKARVWQPGSEGQT